MSCLRSISAQSWGEEHATTFCRSFSTQRKAGMSSFEPSRIPAWEAPVCEERSGSHSVSTCEPSASQRAMVGACPSRMARWSTGRASPSISRKTIPGLSVTTRSPERRAIRCTTLSEYTSSSFVPNNTDRTTPTAAAARATASADQKESIVSPELIRPARSRIPASTNSTRKKPSRAVNGSLSAATSGGNTALNSATSAAATRAVRKVESDAPGTSSVATSSATAPSNHPSTSCPSRKRGRSGCQPGASPWATLTEWPARTPPTERPSWRAASPAPPPGGASPRRTSR